MVRGSRRQCLRRGRTTTGYGQRSVHAHHSACAPRWWTTLSPSRFMSTIARSETWDRQRSQFGNPTCQCHIVNCLPRLWTKTSVTSILPIYHHLPHCQTSKSGGSSGTGSHEKRMNRNRQTMLSVSNAANSRVSMRAKRRFHSFST